MEISTVKQRLTLSQVLTHYGLTPDPQNRLCCPFHNDKTPSLQLYPKTATCYCFSSNCKTHGKAMDVIDFIMHKENLSKHEAILKAQSMITGINPLPTNEQSFKVQSSYTDRTQFLEKLFTYFQNAVYNSKPAQGYIKDRGLDYQKAEIGYNSGQFHHGERKDVQLISDALCFGLLLDRGKLSRVGTPAYGVFGKGCICFALRNQTNAIVSLYFRSIDKVTQNKHFYLKDRQGLYPCYPNRNTEKLILCESIIDAATLLEQEEIKDNYSVLALYGTNGLTDEHKQAIQGLTELSEIVLFMDGDEAGQKALEKYSQLFTEQYPKLSVSQVDTPQGEDINSLLLGHDAKILTHLLDNRIVPSIKQTLIFSTENIESTPIENKKEVEILDKPLLDTSYPYNLKYQVDNILYQVKGFKPDQLDSLKVTLQIQVR